MRALFLQAINNKQTRWYISLAAKWLLVIAAAVLYTILIYRAAGAKAEQRFEAWKERYVADYLAMEEDRLASIPKDPYEVQLEEESQLMAKVLYGIKDNSDRDLRTYCWCVFNRVDSAQYPGTLEEVIAQPNQWMRYSADNPVIDHLYWIAHEQLNNWHKGTTRPISAEYVYMNWSPTDLTLRDRWEEGSRTRYWRFEQ